VGTIIPDFYSELAQIQWTPDGDIIGFYDYFYGPDDDDYPAFVKFDAKTGVQKMAYWYNVTTDMTSSIGTVDKDGNIWLVGWDKYVLRTDCRSLTIHMK
jgi:hypothetical protein